MKLESLKAFIVQQGVSPQQLDDLIAQKQAQFSGLLSEEGAVHLILSEKGLQPSTRALLKDITPKDTAVSLTVRIDSIYPVKHFDKNGRKGSVQSIAISDSSATTRLVFWNDDVHLVSQFQVGCQYTISGCSIRSTPTGGVELTYSSKSKAQKIQPVLTPLFDVVDQQQVSVKGFVVQIFRPTFFVLDKQTRKKTTDVFDPNRHEQSLVWNFILDDSTANIRVVCFGDVAKKVFNECDDILFQKATAQLLGLDIVVHGKVLKNTLANRLEIRATAIEGLPKIE
jgi:ssDNA-binding replication factor A large subunit